MIDQKKIQEILKQSGLEINTTAKDFDKPFADIGLDSLDVYGLLSEIEVETGKSFTEEEYDDLRSLGDIIRLLNA